MQGKKIKIVIVVLAILLAVSLAALIGTLVVRYFHQHEAASVEVPGNIITPDGEDNFDTDKDKPSNSTNAPSGTDMPYSSVSPVPPDATSSAPESTGAAPVSVTKASVIALHYRNPEDNIPFQATNMFPGDTVTKYYCIKVSYKGDIVVRCHVDIRPGYEKLAEVLKVKIRLPETDETLYDGLMQDMSQPLKHELYTNTRTKSELYYEITAYLDTSVGNEYQDKGLIADFRWWVEETDNLDPPETGDASNIYLSIALAFGSFILLLILIGKRRKETADE